MGRIKEWVFKKWFKDYVKEKNERIDYLSEQVDKAWSELSSYKKDCDSLKAKQDELNRKVAILTSENEMFKEYYKVDEEPSYETKEKIKLEYEMLNCKNQLVLMQLSYLELLKRTNTSLALTNAYQGGCQFVPAHFF